MGSSRWADYDLAAKFKSVMDRHATKQIQRFRPGETFATVSTMDEANHRCEVVFPGEESPARIPCGGVLGIEVGDTVRIGGEPGRRHVTGVVNPTGLITPTSDAGGDLTGSFPDPLIGAGKVTAAKIGTDFPHCRVTRSGFTVNDSTETTILYTSEDYDASALHSTSSNTGRITANLAGLWHFGCYVDFGAGIYNAGIAVQLRVNGSTYIDKVQIYANGSVDPILKCSTEYRLAVNDYVEVRATQGSGSNLSTSSAFWGSWSRP